MKTEHILIGAAIVGGIIFLSKNNIGEKAGTKIGESVGGAAGGVVAGAVQGATSSVLIKPLGWSQQQKYIPIVDEAALFLNKVTGQQDWNVFPPNYYGLKIRTPWESIKNIGNPNKWFS